MNTQVTPWYRQRWPWLLMLMPAVAVVAGFATLWLALSTNNAMVVDDYYREGKAINLELARDREAGVRGLAAVLATGDAGVTVRLEAHAGALPAVVHLRVIHATRAELDRAYRLVQIAPGVYADPSAQLPGPGRWQVLIEDPERSWRLLAAAQDFGQPLRVQAGP